MKTADLKGRPKSLTDLQMVGMGILLTDVPSSVIRAGSCPQQPQLITQPHHKESTDNLCCDVQRSLPDRMCPRQQERVESERRERREPTKHADEHELAPVRAKTQPVTGQEASEQSNHETARHIDYRGSGRKAGRQPMRVHEVIHGMTSDWTKGPANGNRDPYAHTGVGSFWLDWMGTTRNGELPPTVE